MKAADGGIAIDPFRDLCPYCLSQLARGIEDDGTCGHEPLLEEFPHLRFNAQDRLSESEWNDSVTRYRARPE